MVTGTAVAGVATADTASASSTRRVCADSVTIRTGDNQPTGYLVGVAIRSNDERLSGFVIAATTTDASGHCQGPYA